MFKSIFSKLIAIFIAIILFSFSIAGATIFYSIGRYVSEEKLKSLEQSGIEIEEWLEFYMSNVNNPIAQIMFERALEQYSQNNVSNVWIIDKEGIIRFSKPEIDSLNLNIKRNLLFEGGYYRLPDEKQYKKVFSNPNATVNEKGDFYGLFKDTGWSWITVQRPVKLVYKNGEEDVVAAVYLSSPISEVNKTRLTVFRFFVVSLIVSVLISIILVYIFSLKITKPLKQINNAAKVIAGGEFKKRLNINSKDEIGELAKSFNQMVAALQNLEDMRRGFIANVSHELRTPMTSIRGFIEGILDGTIPPERHNYYLSIVRDETNRLNRLVNDLLDLAKMESGEVKLSYRNFNINELVRICVIKLENQILEKNIEVEANFDEQELYVHADQDAIERVVYNLIHNAIKFIPEKGKIVISTLEQKDVVFVSVEDNGIGIAKDEIDLIWERFYKSDKSRGRDKTGTGLGLAIIKNIINEHKQEIRVESELGKGTKFTFTLARANYDDKVES